MGRFFHASQKSGSRTPGDVEMGTSTMSPLRYGSLGRPALL